VSRIYLDADLAAGRLADLPAETAAYAVRVLRLRSGDPLVVFNGRGGEYRARLAAGSHGRTLVEVESHSDRECESPLPVTVGLGVSRGERMDHGLQKATELGAEALVPLLTERCVVQLDPERAASRLEHWRHILASACEQCGRNRLPRLGPVTPIADWLAQAGGGARFVLSPTGEASLRDLPAPTGPVVLLIGPEGGLAPAELALARSAGFATLRLGPRTLRTETAVVAALAAIQGLWGDLGGPGGESASGRGPAPLGSERSASPAGEPPFGGLTEGGRASER
jgi:16S rRNA (uracil1498-N3)-methyltransferase